MQWTIQWFERGREGPQLSHVIGNNETMIRLTPYLGTQRNVPFWIYLPLGALLTPLCGRPLNFEGFTYSVVSDSFLVNETQFDTADSIGRGCTAKSNCNGHGFCNYCSEQCECYDGFGSPKDLLHAVSNDFQPDCTSRACPVGHSRGSVGSLYGTDGNMHPLIECSNNGMCNRFTGQCECFEGFGGSACEKMDCPGEPTCSGRGICTSIKALPYKKEALPLIDEVGIYTYGFRRDIYPSTWDADLGRVCLCDSGWTVGYGAGETQQAEYFGPACEFRRCPSGDDPYTIHVDETDCEGKSSIGGTDLGAPGNKCHVDCSNRGTCDYSTGVCHCHPGYQGANCGMRQRVVGENSAPRRRFVDNSNNFYERTFS